MNIPIEHAAEILRSFTGDSCPCNYRDIDEILADESCHMECLVDEHYLGCWIRYILNEVNK